LIGSWFIEWYLSAERLPARFDHAGNHPGQGHFAETNSAKSETTQITALSSATSATVICPDFIFRFFTAFFNHCFSGHERISSFSRLLSERHSHFFKKTQSRLIVFCRCADADIKSAYIGYLIAIDFHKYDLLLDSKSIITVFVE